MTHDHVLLIGGQRCGTTWLQTQLSAHAEIRLPIVVRPEPKYFLSGENHEEYDALFEPSGGRWLLDKSTTYLERPDAARRAAVTVPDAVIVVVVRDPVDRAYSNWRFSTAHGIETLDFEACLTDEAEHRSWSGLSTSPFEYRRRGRYAELMAPWLAAFGSQVVVLQYEQMIGRGAPDYLRDRLGVLDLTDPSLFARTSGPVNAAPDVGKIDPTVASRLAAEFSPLSAPLAELGVNLSLWRS